MLLNIYVKTDDFTDAWRYYSLWFMFIWNCI